MVISIEGKSKLNTASVIYLIYYNEDCMLPPISYIDNSPATWVHSTMLHRAFKIRTMLHRAFKIRSMLHRAFKIRSMLHRVFKIRSMLHRAFKISNSIVFHREIERIKHLFTNNNYHITVINECIEKLWIINNVII